MATIFFVGQFLNVALLDEKLAGFGWVQDGRKKAKCHYLRLQEGEFRPLRGGVLPEYRSQKVHITRHVLLAKSLFEMGAIRLYQEAFEDNEYAWKAHLKAGYREIGRIYVRQSISGNTYVRWL